MSFPYKREFVLLLCSSIALTIVNIWLSQDFNALELFSRPLLSFSVLNVMIFAIIWLSVHDHDQLFEESEDEDDDYISNESEEDDGSYDGLDGYDEDDDDDGSGYEFGWEDEEEEEDYDPELQRRIEGFIAKVVQGWRKEWFDEIMFKSNWMAFQPRHYPP